MKQRIIQLLLQPLKDKLPGKLGITSGRNCWQFKVRCQSCEKTGFRNYSGAVPNAEQFLLYGRKPAHTLHSSSNSDACVSVGERAHQL